MSDTRGNKQAGGRLEGFDLLRGLAALAVLGHHLRLDINAEKTMTWFGQGFLAVDLFFLLSGYVMARSYEPAFARGIGAATFMRVRLERLYPMLLLGGLLGVALFRFYPPEPPAEAAQFVWIWALAGQFLLIPFLGGGRIFAFNNVQWSIVYELLANAVHALGWRWLNLRALLLIAGVSLAALVLTAAQGESLSLGWSRDNFLPGLARVGLAYSLGVVLYRTQPRWQPRLPQLPGWLLGALTLGVLALPELPKGHPLIGWAELASLLTLLALAALAANARANPGIARWLGDMSYPLYAIHTPLLAFLRRVEAHVGDGHGTPALIALLLGCAGIVWLASLVGRWIEHPLMAWRANGPAQRRIKASRSA